MLTTAIASHLRRILATTRALRPRKAQPVHTLAGLAAIALTLGLMVAAEDGAAPSSSVIEAAAPRKVILIQGLRSSSSCDGANLRDTFGDVIDALKDQSSLRLTDADFLGMSYSGSGKFDGYCEAPGANAGALIPLYGPADTCRGIDDARARLLVLMRGRWDGATFDIIGHSMGGVVAAYTIASLPAGDPLVARIHSVVTYDSPLKGMPDARSWAESWDVMNSSCRGFPASARQSLDDLSGDSVPIRAIASRETNDIPVTTVRNEADVVVPADRAGLQGAGDDHLFNIDCDAWNHNCVLHDRSSVSVAVESVTRGAARRQRASESPTDG